MENMEQILYKSKNYKIIIPTKEYAQSIYEALKDYKEIRNPTERIQYKRLARSITGVHNSRITLALFKDNLFVGYATFKKIDENSYKILRMYILKKYRNTKALMCFGDYIYNIWLKDKILLSNTPEMPGFRKKIKKHKGKYVANMIDRLKIVFKKVCRDK